MRHYLSPHTYITLPLEPPTWCPQPNVYKRGKRGHQGRRRQAGVCWEVIWVKAAGSINKRSWHCCALPEHLLLKSNFNLFWYKWNLCVEQHGKWGKLHYVYSCSVSRSHSIQGGKDTLSGNERLIFLVGIFVLSWSTSSGDSVKR